MAEETGSAATRAEEIAELKRQMEEMQRRLEQLSAQDESAAHAVDAESDAGANEADDAVCGPVVSVDASAEEADEEGVPTVEAVPVQNAYGVQQTEEEYAAAAVADFMPQSEPPQPAPPVYGAPGDYAPQAGQQSPYGQQQTQPPASPFGQQPYAQQPGQAAYYQQGGNYYSAPQGTYAQPQGGYQSQYQQPLVRTKDHVAAGLLAIFLGVFGVHKFYLGYNTAGFILLGVTILGGIFTFGIAASVVWLIGIIEGVMYLTKSQPEFEQIYVFNKREWF